MVFPWPKNLMALGLIQLKPAPILEWWPKKWAKVYILVNQYQGSAEHIFSQNNYLYFSLDLYVGVCFWVLMYKM